MTRSASVLVLLAASTTILATAAGRLAADEREDAEWWSFRQLARPSVPELTPEEEARARTPIDAFVIARLRERGLSLSPEADRRTLVRRLYFDLTGLPPSPAAVEAFVEDDDPLAWERLIDRLLDSPAYGERWARHWLDVVKYADTHGYDKDKPRPNAWPYRDWVVRALNDDEPYSRFVREQLAGDVLWPNTRDGIEATGFIAAGPWDFIGHVEVPETKIDGKVARNLDRDDMVGSASNAFLSLTIQCARCHDHKFDPVTQHDYYSFQAVFAALDRADRAYDADPETAARRAELAARRESLRAQREALASALRERAGEALARIDDGIALHERKAAEGRDPRYGYHSAIEASADREKWVRVDLGEEVEIDRVVLAGAYDDFASIGAGFGFPRRFRVEVAATDSFEDSTVIADRTAEDVPNPGIVPVVIDAGGARGRWVRVTATSLALRSNDWIFALAELRVMDGDGVNRAAGRPVSALDSIEAPVRWASANLVDGVYPGAASDPARGEDLARLVERRRELLASVAEPGEVERLEELEGEVASCEAALAALPPQGMVYAGTIHNGSGAFRGTGPDGGRPREIRVLRRGEVTQPREVVGPAAPVAVGGLDKVFELPPEHPEGERRRALAEWIVDPRNGLTWRSIVNRVWLHHFGRGIVETPNDFGRMGALPTHPELLDWLAVEFRDGGQSLKDLHRLILKSAVYRQSSAGRAEAEEIDAGNRFLWRMHRRRLAAEEVRDAVLAVSGRLDRTMYGPGFQSFVIEKPQHSPHYEYDLADPEDPATHRRAIYRFIVRSQPDPYFRTLDCADSSQSVAKRDETLTSLQALALLNDDFMVTMARHFAARLAEEADAPDARVARAWQLALGREPSSEEREALVAYATEHGLDNACRVIFNLNEFVFVD